jgi:hypothetical protein
MASDILLFVSWKPGINTFSYDRTGWLVSMIGHFIGAEPETNPERHKPESMC